MAEGILNLYRSPLREGEPVYTLGCIDQGVFSEGVHKGEKKPQLQSLFPAVLDDGRLRWQLLDSEDNRALVQGLLPICENPLFAYSVEYPEDITPKEVAEVKRSRRRPKKDAE